MLSIAEKLNNLQPKTTDSEQLLIINDLAGGYMKIYWRI
jgi:hypothetical protein